MRSTAIIATLFAVFLAAAPAGAQTSGNGNERGGDTGGSGEAWTRDTNQPLGCKNGGSAGSRGCGRVTGVSGAEGKKNPSRVIIDSPSAGPIIAVKPATKPVVRKASAPKVVKPKVQPKTVLATLPRPTARPNTGPILVGDFVPDEVLVTIDGDSKRAASLAAQFNLVIRSEHSSLLLGSRVVRFGIPDGRAPEAVIAALSTAGIPSAYVNSIYSLQGMRLPANYAYERIGVSGTPAGGKGVSVAVIDSATDPKHPALKKIYAGFFDALPDFPVVNATHGTAVGGLIAGRGDLPGMAPQARIYHARAFENGKSTMDAILTAFDWAAGQKVRIVNMSFAGPANDLMRQSCAAALDRGIVLVAAAGNNGPGAKPAYPGAYAGVIAVTATNDKDALMPQANRGDYVFVAAPGVDVIAPAPGGGADFVTGTSFAAAIVSGAIANLIADDPRRDDKWVERTLSESALDLGAAGRDNDFGYGLLSVPAAAKLAAN